MKPLAGITVLDFSRVLAAPMATQILAELGAEVLKIERPGAGDETRRFEPRLPHGESAYFFAFNRGKKSICLDLKSARGREIACDLARGSDALVENFLPGTMERLGLGFEALSAENPRLVYLSSTGFGQSGPYRDRKGYDTIFQALSGLMSLTGHRDGPPAKAGVPIANMSSGLWIAVALLAALVGREASGRGARIDLSMLDVQVSLLAVAASRLFALGEEPVRNGTEHPGRVPSAAFACADGDWLQISGGDQHWPMLCDVLGLDALANDPSLRSNAGRVANRDRVSAALRTAIATRERDELAAALRERGVPVGEVNTVREILEDPHARARDLVGSFEHASEGSFPALRSPVRIEGFDDPDVGVPPLLGADTDDVLRERCGLTPPELAALHAEGVI